MTPNSFSNSFLFYLFIYFCFQKDKKKEKRIYASRMISEDLRLAIGNKRGRFNFGNYKDSLVLSEVS